MSKHPSSPPFRDHEDPTAPIGRSGEGLGGSSFLLSGTRHGEMPAAIDRYKIIRELGRGGMGVVYLAKRSDDAITAPVAIKVLKRGLDTDHIIRRFNLERQLMGALNHPNIARFFDAGTTPDGLPYLVMEFVEGEPLDKHCDTAQLTVQQRLRIFLKVCAGVHALHQNLVVHRDLKPTNILVTSQGEPKLLDLGIAKLVNPVMGGLAEQTVGDHQMMTPEYASPEQVAGRAITTASDIYSLGMILYELLTGDRAYQFANRNTEEIRRVVCDVDPEKPSIRINRIIRTGGVGTRAVGGDPASSVGRPAASLTKRLPPPRLARTLEGDLDDIVMMALEKVHTRRYASVQDLAADIERYLADEPVTARRTNRRGLYQAAKFVHRNRKAVAGAAAGVLVLSTSAVVAIAGWNNANRAVVVEREAAASKERALKEVERQVEIAKAERAAKDIAIRQVLDAVMFSLTSTYNDVKRLDAPNEALRGIVESASRYAAELRRQMPEDPTVLAAVAESYEKLGSLQYGPDAPHMGEPTKAAASFRECIEVRTQIAADAASGVKGRTALWQAYRFAGQVSTVLGRPQEAEEYFRESLRFADTGGADSPERDALRRAVTNASRNEALRDLGRWREAEAAVLESLRDRKARAEAEPNSTESRTRLASGYAALGEFLLDAGRAAEAVDPLRKNLDIRSALAPEGATGQARRMLGNARLLLGEALAQIGRADEGLSLMRRAEEDLDVSLPEAAMSDGPVQEAPSAGTSVPDARRIGNLAEIVGRLGAAYLKAGKSVDAARAFDLQLARAQELLLIDAGNFRARLQLVGAMRGRAQALAAQGRAEDAVRVAEGALAEARRAVPMAPGSGRAKRALALAVEARLEAGGLRPEERRQLLDVATDAVIGTRSAEEWLPADRELMARLAAKAEGADAKAK